MSNSTQFLNLLSPVQLGDLQLNNSVVMAPLTRCKADDDLVPTDEIAAYYERRADAGLIISEATIVMPNGQGYPNTPGIYSEAQVEGWKKVTDRVHEKGGKIFLQLWHVGRASHPVFLNGDLPVAPSAVPLTGRVHRGGGEEVQYGTPRALETEELAEYIEAFAQGAANAMEAGFDGVEIHGANGYLIDQFLHENTNLRTDNYGGSVENRARFALEIVDAVLARVSSKRVGIRLSPGGYFNDIETSEEDAETFKYVLKELEGRDLAYVHTGIFDDSMEFEPLGGRVTPFLRANYKGTVMGCGSYTPETADKALGNNVMDLAALGRPFIANPDLVARLKAGQELKEYDEATLDTLF